MDYSHYQHMKFEKREHGVMLITLNRPERLNATDAAMHRALSRIWIDLADDDDVRVVVITGAGRAFSAGGDFEIMESVIGNQPLVAQMLKETRDLVHNMMNFEKPVIAAINGAAVGAGLAVALMSDITIAGKSAKMKDGHIALGIAAGDHAALMWPLLVGMAKTKYYLMSGESIDGTEAERIGLVSKCVPDDELLPTALALADKLATGPAQAVRWTKLALNQWLKVAALTSYDYSTALEMLGMLGPDFREGSSAIQEKRKPQFH